MELFFCYENWFYVAQKHKETEAYNHFNWWLLPRAFTHSKEGKKKLIENQLNCLFYVVMLSFNVWSRRILLNVFCFNNVLLIMQRSSSSPSKSSIQNLPKSLCYHMEIKKVKEKVKQNCSKLQPQVSCHQTA